MSLESDSFYLIVLRKLEFIYTCRTYLDVYTHSSIYFCESSIVLQILYFSICTLL